MRSCDWDIFRVPVVVASALLGVVLAAPAHAALQGRDVDKDASNGFEAYYDTALDITWLADANYAKTSGFSLFGGLSWDESMLWVNQLVYFNVSGWRLPSILAKNSESQHLNDGGAALASSSELGFMYYNNLSLGGNIAPQSGVLVLPGGAGGFIKNFEANFYWTKNVYAQNQSLAWGLWTSFPFAGAQSIVSKTQWMNAWAVHDGDPFGVKVIPDTPHLPAVDEPSTAMLLLAGLGVAAHMVRQRKGLKQTAQTLA